MSLSTFGRRYERLLFMSVPLSLISILVLFVGIALISQQDRIMARCYESAADFLSVDEKPLEQTWARVLAASARPGGGGMEGDFREFATDLQQKVHNGMQDKYCGPRVASEAWQRFVGVAPSQIIKKLREDAQRLNLTPHPVDFYGISIPEKAAINWFGTSVQIGLSTFMSVLQILLGPILILWLGSLFHTRFREALLISRANTIVEIFPHLLNFYPVGSLPVARKKSWTIYYFPIALGLLFAILRTVLLIVFVAPAAITYIAGMHYFATEGILSFLLFFFGFLVIVNFLAVLSTEFRPWHIKKVFSRQ